NMLWIERGLSLARNEASYKSPWVCTSSMKDSPNLETLESANVSPRSGRYAAELVWLLHCSRGTGGPGDEGQTCNGNRYVPSSHACDDCRGSISGCHGLRPEHLEQSGCVLSQHRYRSNPRDRDASERRQLRRDVFLGPGEQCTDRPGP